MEEIAEVYARSLFEVAKEHDVLDRVHDELGEFADALDEDRDAAGVPVLAVLLVARRRRTACGRS